METERQPTFLDHFPNAMAGAYQISSIELGTIIRVHTDGSGRKLYSADVATFKEGPRYFVPFASPYAAPDGTAGFFYMPERNDKCLIGLTAANTAFIIGFVPSASVQPDKTKATPDELRGGFLSGQPPLSGGSMSMLARSGNEIRVMRGGNILIKARQNQKTLYDHALEVIRTVTRNYQLTTSGGDFSWKDNNEPNFRTADLVANLYSRASTTENREKGVLRGGGLVTIKAGEEAQYLQIIVKDDQNSATIAIGPSGDFLTIGVNDTAAIKLSDNTIGLIAGTPSQNAQLTVSGNPPAVTVNVTSGGQAIGLVVNTDGSVTISSPVKVTLEAPLVETTATTRLSRGSLPLARGNMIDKVMVTGVQGGSGTAFGNIMTGSPVVTGV